MTTTPKPLALLLCLGSTACVGAPFILPPAQLELGGGLRQIGPRGDQRLDAPFVLRASVHPLKVLDHPEDRRLDAGLGFLLDQGASDSTVGGFVTGGVTVAQGPLWGDFGRLSVHGQARLLSRGDRLGGGGAVQLQAEWFGYQERDFERQEPEGGSFGASFGEAAVGLFVETAWQATLPEHGWSVSAGLAVRSPAAIGFAYRWLWAVR